MPEIVIDNIGLPLFRLTLLGSNYSGKTLLANAFVNNFVSPVYKHTTLPEYLLYYYVHRLSNDKPIVNMEYDDVNAFCFEIEDTTTDINILSFLDLQNIKYKYDEEVTNFVPFNFYDAPLTPLNNNDKYQPIAQRRMAFLVLFDVTSRESYTSAVSIIELILSRTMAIGNIQPIVAMVANKIDLLSSDSELFTEAETYTQSKTIPLYKISTITRKNINTMIKEIALLIYGNVRLWELVLQDD